MCGRGRLRALASRWPSLNRPGGRGLNAGVPRRQCGRKSSGRIVGVCPRGPRWAPDPSTHNDVIVVIEFDVGQMHAPIVLSFVDDHSQHLGHTVLFHLEMRRNRNVTRLSMVRALQWSPSRAARMYR